MASYRFDSRRRACASHEGNSPGVGAQTVARTARKSTAETRWRRIGLARCGGSWQDTRDGAVVRNGVVVLLAEGWRRKKREKKGVNGGDRQRLAPKLELWWDFGLKFGGGSDFRPTSEPKKAGVGLHKPLGVGSRNFGSWGSSESQSCQGPRPKNTRGDLSLVTRHLRCHLPHANLHHANPATHPQIFNNDMAPT